MLSDAELAEMRAVNSRQRADTDTLRLLERGIQLRHLPGRHPQQAHAGVSAGKLYTWAQIVGTYGEQIDESVFDDDSFVSVHERGEMFIGLKMDSDRYRVVADFSASGARRLADAVRDTADTADRYDPHSPDATPASANGLVDWSVIDGVLVGYTPLGEVSIRYVGDSDSDDLDQFDGLDTGPDGAVALADALEEMAEVADEYERSARLPEATRSTAPRTFAN